MNTTELAAFVAEQNNIPKTEARRIVDSVFDGIQHGLSADGKAKLGQLGTLSIRFVEGRQVRNPATGVLVDIPAGHKPIFRASAHLKNIVR